jgi:hypothetical protein
MDFFTPVDTLDTTNFLRAVIQPNLSSELNALLPVTGFENQGQPVTPPGFDKEYGLFLTINASVTANPNGSANTFNSLNITLWADPKNDAGTPSVSQTSDPAFSNGMANDIVLATGTMVSASMSLDPTTNIRSADFVDTMTPTLAGTVLLGGSIQPGTELEVKTTTPPDSFTSITPPGGGFINLVDGGTAQVTLDPQGTILLPNITHEHLQLADVPKFIHGRSDGHHGDDRREG